jgi:hypothetical protein
MFSIYRVLQIPGKLKLETITAPFTGDVVALEYLKSKALETPWPKKLHTIAQNSNLAPTTFHFSGKASPSNVNSSQGLLSDIYLLLSHPQGEVVYTNILKYLDIVGKV